MESPSLHALVLYKTRPARVKHVGTERLQIDLENTSRSVRPKDVVPIHPGPISQEELCSLDSNPVSPEVDTVWELLSESDPIDFPTLCDLLFGRFTPQTAWATWKIFQDGLLFRGTPETIVAIEANAVAEERSRRLRKTQEQEQWKAFVARLRSGSQCESKDWSAEEQLLLTQIEQLAYNRRDDSRALRDLKISETHENAHALLLQIGWWTIADVPYADRFKLNTSPITYTTTHQWPKEERIDLTHLTALAIDDEGNRDPDDAISFDPKDDTAWVHIADASCIVTPDSELDLAARDRGATLYLPEKSVPMLPTDIIENLGLGLKKFSSALSFQLQQNTAGEVAIVDFAPTIIAVQRLTYAQAELQLIRGDSALLNLHEMTERSQLRRKNAGAVTIDWPEAHIRVERNSSNQQVYIEPLAFSRSRSLVSEMMIMTGEAVAQFASDQKLPFPYAVQDSPNELLDEESINIGFAGFLKIRKTQRPARQSSIPGEHHGLGVKQYSRTTSPLRRYLDLVAHQQLRLYRNGSQTLSETDILNRVGSVEVVCKDIRRAEQLSRRHWTLVYLKQHPQWKGDGIIVEQQRTRNLVLIPELALEIELYTKENFDLNTVIKLQIVSVDLPRLNAHFEMLN